METLRIQKVHCMWYIGVLNNTLAVKGVFTILIKKLEQIVIHVYSNQQGGCHIYKGVIEVNFMEVAYVYSYETECPTVLFKWHFVNEVMRFKVFGGYKK